jgi:hypothetical protein
VCVQHLSLTFHSDLPHQPPFDFELPNYYEVGKTLFKLAHEYPYDDSPAAEISIEKNVVETVSWNMLAMPELGQIITHSARCSC